MGMPSGMPIFLCINTIIRARKKNEKAYHHSLYESFNLQTK